MANVVDSATILSKPKESEFLELYNMFLKKYGNKQHIGPQQKKACYKRIIGKMAYIPKNNNTKNGNITTNSTEETRSL